ncbi:MAG: hypothetical protein ACOC95_09095 [Planctomycetota bacterium]
MPTATVAELAAAYEAHAAIYYRRRDGKAGNVSMALRPLIDAYGDRPADSVGREEVRQLRDAMIARGLARTTINKRIGVVKRFYR